MFLVVCHNVWRAICIILNFKLWASEMDVCYMHKHIFIEKLPAQNKGRQNKIAAAMTVLSAVMGGTDCQ